MTKWCALSRVAALWITVTLVVVLGFAQSVRGQEEGEAQEQGQANRNVAATIDGVPITWDEINRNLAVKLYELGEQARELRMQELREVVERTVLQKEAEKRGTTVVELLRSEVESKMGEVTEEELDSFLAAQRLDRTDENVDRVRNHLRGARWMRRYREFMESLDVQSRVLINALPVLRPPVVAISVDDDPSRGPEDAPVTIVEFGDFTCGYCRRSRAVVKRVLEEYGDKVRMVYRDFPLGDRTRGWRAAEAAQCAGVQDKFWEFYDSLFEEPGALDDAGLKAHAQKVGLDEEAFTACLESGRFSEEVKGDKEAGRRAGVTATPTFFINGRYVRGAQPYSVFKQMIDEELEQSGSP